MGGRLPGVFLPRPGRNSSTSGPRAAKASGSRKFFWGLRARVERGGRWRGVPIAEHIVGTTRGRARQLIAPELARWLWVHLAAALPEAFSFVLMVDHFHLMAPPGRRERVRRVLGSFTRRFGVRMEVEAAERATTPKILGRQIRYGFYNPVRAGFVKEPWEWPWSTLRDLGQACFPIWTPLESVARHLQLPPERALRGLSHLSACRPEPPGMHALEVISSHNLLHAVGATLRLPPREVLGDRQGRRLIVPTAAQRTRPPSSTDLAELLGVSSRAVRHLRTPEHPALSAALLCASNPQLQRPVG